MSTKKGLVEWINKTVKNSRLKHLVLGTCIANFVENVCFC